MQIGAIFPYFEIGSDPIAIRDYAQAVEQLGYSHLLAADHVLGADPDRPGGFRGPYTYQHPFHEPLVLFGYLAGITQRIGLGTWVIIMPQRQTALVAKQAAAVDVLSGGRLRLGLGIGWNEVEYEALGENFHNRGRRLEEQIAVLRALWTEPVVTFEGRWHKITKAGINPMPVQRPIPIWLGGRDERMLRRVARMADGWFPLMPPDDSARALIKQLHDYAREIGRAPGTIGIEARVSLAGHTPDEWIQELQAWRNLGATAVSAYTMGGSLPVPQGHIDALRRFKEATVGIL